MPVFITSHQLLSFPPTHTRLTATHYKRFFAAMPRGVPEMQLKQKKCGTTLNEQCHISYV